MFVSEYSQTCSSSDHSPIHSYTPAPDRTAPPLIVPWQWPFTCERSSLILGVCWLFLLLRSMITASCIFMYDVPLLSTSTPPSPIWTWWIVALILYTKGPQGHMWLSTCGFQPYRKGFTKPQRMLHPVVPHPVAHLNDIELKFFRDVHPIEPTCISENQNFIS